MGKRRRRKKLPNLDLKNEMAGDFPGGSVGQNLAASAGDTGSVPGSGRFHVPHSNKAHEPQLLSTCAPANEAHAPIACAPQ